MPVVKRKKSRKNTVASNKAIIPSGEGLEGCICGSQPGPWPWGSPCVCGFWHDGRGGR